MSSKSYSGPNESILLRQVQEDHPDGFEILSIKSTGFLWWRKVILRAQPLAPGPQHELSKMRLLSAIYTQREQRQHQAALHDVMSHAHDFDPQRRS